MSTSARFALMLVCAGIALSGGVRADSGIQYAISSSTTPKSRVQQTSSESVTIIKGTIVAESCLGHGKPCVDRPMAGCTVTVASSERFSYNDFVKSRPSTALSAVAVTDVNGDFMLQVPLAIEGEPVSVSVRKSGYATGKKDTTLTIDGLDLDFRLGLDRPVALASGLASVGSAGSSILSYSARDRLLSIRIPRNQHVSIDAYLINGKKEERLSTKRYFAAGTYTFSLDGGRFGSGIAVITVKGEGFSESKKVPLPGRG